MGTCAVGDVQHHLLLQDSEERLARHTSVAEGVMHQRRRVLYVLVRARVRLVSRFVLLDCNRRQYW